MQNYNGEFAAIGEFAAEVYLTRAADAFGRPRAEVTNGESATHDKALTETGNRA